MKFYEEVCCQTWRVPCYHVVLGCHRKHVQRCWVTGTCFVLHICGEYNLTPVTLLYKFSVIINLHIFKDILIESDVVGQGQIKGVMSGKHYNRSMHCHKVMCKALHRLRFQVFLDSVSDD